MSASSTDSEQQRRNSEARNLSAPGVLACAGYAAHAAYHISKGHPEEALWTCHVSALLVGAGLILGSARLNAVGLLGLTIGLPMWILYLAGGGPFIPTSPLTHVLGLALGIYGARRMGVPAMSWAAAVGFGLLMLVLSRALGPAEANVNLAFGPIAGLSLWALGPQIHWVLLLAQWAAGLWAAQAFWRKTFRQSR